VKTFRNLILSGMRLFGFCDAVPYLYMEIGVKNVSQIKGSVTFYGRLAGMTRFVKEFKPGSTFEILYGECCDPAQYDGKQVIARLTHCRIISDCIPSLVTVFSGDELVLMYAKATCNVELLPNEA